MNLDLRVFRERDWHVMRASRQFFIVRADHTDLLPSGLSCAYVAREKNVSLSERAAAAEGRFSPLLALPPGMLLELPLAGTPKYVSRALRLISETGLEEGGVKPWPATSEWARAIFGACFCVIWGNTQRCCADSPFTLTRSSSRDQLAHDADRDRWGLWLRAAVQRRILTSIIDANQIRAWLKSARPARKISTLPLNFRPPTIEKNLGVPRAPSHARRGNHRRRCFRRSISVNENRDVGGISRPSCNA